MSSEEYAMSLNSNSSNNTDDRPIWEQSLEKQQIVYGLMLCLTTPFAWSELFQHPSGTALVMTIVSTVALGGVCFMLFIRPRLERGKS